ncbi:MAG: cobalamin B12-binding domain-containing protein [Promethearchaeota archaeon]
MGNLGSSIGDLNTEVFCMSERKIRVLMSKPGIDGHWRGGIVVSRAIRDAGMELIFGGFQNVHQIVESAIQEDVDVIGLSIHSGAHFAYTQQVIDLLKERGVIDNIMILVGGVVPAKDFPKLKEMGVANIYGPGSMTSDIVEFIKTHVKK